MYEFINTLQRYNSFSNLQQFRQKKIIGVRTKTFSTHVTPKSGHDVRGKRQNTHEKLLLPELYGKTAASGHEHRNHTLRCDILLRNNVSLRILLVVSIRSISVNLRHVCLSWV